MMPAANVRWAVLLLAMATTGCSIQGVVGFHADDAAMDPSPPVDSSVAQSGGDDAASDPSSGGPNDAGQPPVAHLEDGGEGTHIDDVLCDDFLCLDAGNSL